MSDLEKQTQPTSFEPNRPQPAEKLTSQEENDLADIIAVLAPVPERDPLAAERSQARFLAELEALGLPATPTPVPGRLNAWLRNLPISKKKETNMSTPAQRFAFSTFALIALIVVFLFGGAGSTVFAAQGALPGDALFQVKTSLEQTQTNLSSSATDRAELHLEFADRRLSEIERLVAQARFNDVASASMDFESHISAAQQELKDVEKEHPDQSAALGQKISDDLSRFNQTLSEIKHQVPDNIKGEVEHAIQAVHSTPASVDDKGSNDKSKGTLEPGDDRGTVTPEPGDDKGSRTLEPGDDKGTSTLEPGDDKGVHETEQPKGTDDGARVDDKGGSSPSLTLTPGTDDHGGSGSVNPTQTPRVDDHSGSGSGSNSPTSTPSSNSGSGSGGGSGSGSGGGDDGGGHK